MKDEGKEGGKVRSFPVDPNLPRWVCQNCRHALCIVGVESYADKFYNDSSRSGMQGSSVQGSMVGSTRMDNSFVILSKQKAQAHGVPPRPRSVASPSEGNPPMKGIEESFVVLPPAAASMYNSASTSEGVGVRLATPTASATTALQSNNSGFHSSITVLKKAFDIATSQTQVDQPLCLECMRVLSNKLDKEIEDVNMDIKAYEACLQRSELESYDVLSDADFFKEKLKIEEEERRLQAAIEDTERQFVEVKAEKKELESKSKLFKELEERYWHEFNNFQFQLASHQEERDAILAKIEVLQAHLELLKRTNVLADAFPIWHDGEFGTINNFRLGRSLKHRLNGMKLMPLGGKLVYFCTQWLIIFGQNFRNLVCLQITSSIRYRIKIIPMGSYPRIMDSNNNTYELFGPVNLFWSTRYDKAMTLFLTCLKEFADFANAMDQEKNIPPEKRLRLPYKIENDKVETYTITQSFNKQENWTKALRYMLCNLKWVLFWFIVNTHFQPLSMSSHRSEAPVVGPVDKKQSSRNRNA
ncbi:hypothetical protein HPP92_011453 [Vanilla planifolia]|uniref:Beclin-1-like protein n=1 Tax=Vanilla planifolia TaxID=51239 RepID=A0A835V1T9_VANPL|nr:hypothetical protein HPP92_011453 [Vanilla planifolia]